MLQTVWVEIPVRDIERAAKFYQTLFDLQPTEFAQDGVRRTATLANTSDAGHPGFSLTQTANFEPGNQGPLVYLYAGDDLSAHLNRVESAGGKIVEGKTSMGGMGNYATFMDTEGNLLALYSTN